MPDFDPPVDLNLWIPVINPPNDAHYLNTDIDVLQEFFRRKAYEEYYPDQMRERTSTEIKMRIRPNRRDIPRELRTELWSNSMELSRSNSNNDIVIVSGIPPNDDFDESKVMEVIKKYAPNAEVV